MDVSNTIADEIAIKHDLSRIACNLLISILPLIIGLWLLQGIIQANSATYDEVMYVKLACRWWRTGELSDISSMGSPVTFWRWQSALGLAWMDWSGRGLWIDHPLDFISHSLPVLRTSALWFWAIGLWGVQGWAWRLYGRVAALLTGLVYALGPNLLAHGALFTMECPLWASWLWACWAFWAYLRSGKMGWLAISAMIAGVTFSMKFTAVLLPPVLLCMGVLHFLKASGGHARMADLKMLLARISVFMMLMIMTNLVITGFAVVPISQQRGEHPLLERNLGPRWAARCAALLEIPWPVDWVGFLNQLKHQRNGGPSYLFGEVSENGWKWYYLVSLAVKVPLAVSIALFIRCFLVERSKKNQSWFLPLSCLLFLAVACVMSKRNYGFRYLLPLAPVMIVWLGGLVQSRFGRMVAVLLLISLGVNIARVHPWELTYFNEAVDGPEEGRKILADSNLDWGQGLLQFKEMQRERPELANCTLFYFGDLDPAYYGVNVKSYVIDASDKFAHLPRAWGDVQTPYVAVSTSLSDGPWGPALIFRLLRLVQPAGATSDGSIRIYEMKSVKSETIRKYSGADHMGKAPK